jgi:hypothetical protein
MKTWDDWSCFDLSFAVAKLHQPNNDKIQVISGKVCVGALGGHTDDSYTFVYFDINSWADMGPIIFSKNISIINIKNTTQWFACADVEFENICMSPDGNDSGISSMSTNHASYCTKPLRAAAIVFLMMNGVKP